MIKKNCDFYFKAALIFILLTNKNAWSNDILVGQINAQTGGGSSLGQPLSVGAQVYFDSINAAGGIRGRKISLLTLDDQFNELQTLALAEKLMTDNKIVALINTVGAPNIDNLISTGFLDKHRLTVVGPLTNSTTARDRKNPYVFFVRAGLQEEINAMVKQIDILGFKRVGIFYQNDISGQDGLKLIRQALSLKGIKPVAEAAYEKQNFKAENARQIFRQTNPEVILSISVAAATSDLVRMMGRSISSGSMIIANSGNSSDVILKELGTELARGLAIVQVMPGLQNSAFPLIRQFLNDFERHAPANTKVNIFSLEGYISAKVLCAALAQIKGDVDRQSLFKAMSSMKPFDLGGYTVNFANGNRLGSNYAEVAVITGAGKLSR